MDEDAIPWLTDAEQALWRRWMRLNAALPAALHRDLQADGLSLPDFEVLVQLTDRPDHRLRTSELARALHWERSRVSHHVTRMLKRGLVLREECPDDGRGAYVVLTDAGRAAIHTAAPGHVRAVRRLVFDALSPEDIAAVDAVFERVLARVDPIP